MRFRSPHSFLVLVFWALLPGPAVRADVSLAPIFSDHVVLQRHKPIPLWGTAKPGETITVTFGAQSATAQTGPDGRWLVQLDPQPANAEGRDLVVTGNNTVTIHDVLVGEVWLCSGQSNMEFTVNNGPGAVYRVVNADAEVAAARFPLIRHFKVGRAVADSPAASAGGSWAVCSPATVGQFTAVGYFFARDVHQNLGVPVGLVHSSWGGTPIEAWLDAPTLAGNPAFAEVPVRWQQTLAEYPKLKPAHDAAVAEWTAAEAQAKAAGPEAYAAWLPTHTPPRPLQGPGGFAMPSGLFNGMIAPLPPLAIRGVLWYQGEGNTGRPREYQALFTALIASWRARFDQGDIPFLWVQIANFKVGPEDNDNWAVLREAQARALALPNTGMAVTIDIGDDKDVHPRNKQEVGRRLALIANAQVYGQDAISGPVYSGLRREGAALRVFFTHALTGLVSSGGEPHSFEVAGPDRKFHPATAVIQGETILVRAEGVTEPVAVRYGWRNAPGANLGNGAGLPVTPFRSSE